jgi:hypothetical protein
MYVSGPDHRPGATPRALWRARLDYAQFGTKNASGVLGALIGVYEG